MPRRKVVEKKKISRPRRHDKRPRKQAIALNMLLAAVAVLVVLGVFLFVLMPLFSSGRIIRGADGKSYTIQESIDKKVLNDRVMRNREKNKQ